jgi:hypothetical protein
MATKNTKLAGTADTDAVVPPALPGGGSWRWTGAEWVKASSPDEAVVTNTTEE